MFERGLWFFLQLPYNLSLVFLIAWLYKDTTRKRIPLLITALVLLFGLWLEGFPGIFFWLPSGASTIIAGAVATLIYLNIYSKKHKSALKIPKDVCWDRSVLKQELTSVKVYEERQQIYLDFVKKLNGFLSKIDKKVGPYVNQYFMVTLAVLFCVNFGYWVLHYWADSLQISHLFDKSKMESLVTDEKTRTELLKFYEQHGKTILNYSASLTMVLNTLSLFLILSLVRWIRSRKNKGYFFWLDICFFRLPEPMVLVYIPALALFIASIFYNVLDEYAHWFGNLVFMLSFLYLLNGVAITRFYAKVRFLPSGIIFLIIFFSSWFIPEAFLFFIVALFGVGLFDFLFDIRKKALQHVPPRKDQ